MTEGKLEVAGGKACWSVHRHMSHGIHLHHTCQALTFYKAHSHRSSTQTLYDTSVPLHNGVCHK